MTGVNSTAVPVRVTVIGIGKMGLSHLSVARGTAGVELVGVCDAAEYLLDVLSKYTGLATFTDATRMLDETKPDAVIIATPTGSHAELVRSALDRGVNVFCEKPLTLSATESAELAALAAARGLVAQVGYHNRFVATFREVGRLLDAGAIGRPTHVLAEAYGPVVLKAKGATWRSRRESGGGCLYDYAAHPLNLITWWFGLPDAVRGTTLNSIFSADIDDEVYSSLSWNGGLSAHLSVNWSDESHRKMSTSVTITGEQGRIEADRQEIRVYLRDGATVPSGYRTGWTVRDTTELTEGVGFYLRGEEYTAQIESFVAAIADGDESARENSFTSAAITDRVIERILADASGTTEEPVAAGSTTTTPRRRRIWGRS